MIIAIKVQLNGIDKISDKRQEKEFLLIDWTDHRLHMVFCMLICSIKQTRFMNYGSLSSLPIPPSPAQCELMMSS